MIKMNVKLGEIVYVKLRSGFVKKARVAVLLDDIGYVGLLFSRDKPIYYCREGRLCYSFEGAEIRGETE